MTNTMQGSEAQGEQTTGLYLYCIVEGTSEPKGLSEIKGIADQSLRAVGYKDFQAIVSEVDTQKAKQATRENLMKHAEVQEAIMKRQQLLPVRFGLIPANESEIINGLLEPHYSEFKELFRKLNGKREVDVKLYLNEQSLLQNIVQTNEQIRQMRDQLSGKSDQSAYQERIKLGEMVESLVSSTRDEIKNDTLQCLSTVAEDHRENKLLTDTMLLNAAFLVPNEKEEEFASKLKTLDDKYKGLLNIKYIPSAPPYNFVNVAVSPGAQQ